MKAGSTGCVQSWPCFCTQASGRVQCRVSARPAVCGCQSALKKCACAFKGTRITVNLDLKKTLPPPPSPRRWRSPGCAGLELLCGVRRSPLDLMSRGGRSLFALDWPGEPPGEGPGGSRISDVQALPVSYPCLHAVSWLSGFHALTWGFLFSCSEIAPRPPLVPWRLDPLNSECPV